MLFYLLLLVFIKGDDSIESAGDESIISSGDESIVSAGDESIESASDESIESASDESIVSAGDESIESTDDDSISPTVEDTSKRTISVVAFYDYEIEMKNENDVLNIEVPDNTFILISSLDGYTATIYKSRDVSEENVVQSIIPDPFNRLIYFKLEGLLIVTSTKASLKFKFHSLPINKVNSNSFSIKKLVVSTNTKETFHIYPNNYNYEQEYTNYSYNYGKIAVWFAKDQVTVSNVYSKPQSSILHCAYSFDDPENDAPVSFTDINPLTQTKIQAKSKLFILDEKTSEQLPILIDDISDISNNDDHYDHFRVSISDITKKSDTEIVQRGNYDDKIGMNCIYSMDVFKEGISSFDFSVADSISIYNAKQCIFIFPSQNEIRISSEKNVFGFYNYNSKTITMASSNTPENENENTIDHKYIKLTYDGYDSNQKIIISTSPTETLIIDGSSNTNANFTNERNSYYYVMASLQNTETTVTFTGQIKVTLIKTEKCELIDIKSGDKIEGPFKAEIDHGAQCEFRTTPKGELKPHCTDNNRLSFKWATTFALFSSIYQSTYDTFDARKDQNSAITMNNVNIMKITTYNIIYVHEQKGWKGEIIDPQDSSISIDDLQVGPHLNRTAFYYTSPGRYLAYFIYFIVRKIDVDSNFVIHIATHSTVTVRGTVDDGYCSKLVVFNEIPAYFHITTRKDIKNSIYMENSGYGNVCMFPVFKIYNIGFRTNLSGNVAVIDPYFKPESYTHSFGSSEYFGGELENFYHYSGDTFILLYVQTDPRKNADAYIHLIYQAVESETDNGILPDEPKFYSIVSPSIFSKGLFVLENMKTQNDNNDDDNNDDDNNDNDNNDDNKDENSFVISNQINGQKTIDMTRISLYTLKCPKSTIVHFHMIYGLIIEAYDSKGNKFHELNQDSTSKFINFGESGGEIRIKKTSSSKHLLDESKVTYSYLVRDNTPPSDRCSSIFISNDYKTKFVIGGSRYKESSETRIANVTASDGQNFCAWFSYPVPVGVQLINDLFASHEIYNNNVKVENAAEVPFITGSSIFFFLKNAYSNIHRAEFNPSLPENADTSAFDQNPICEVVKLPDINGAIQKEVVPQSTTPSEGDSNSKLAIILIVVISVVVVAVIIVVVVVCVRKKKKNRDMVSSDEDQP